MYTSIALFALALIVLMGALRYKPFAKFRKAPLFNRKYEWFLRYIYKPIYL